MEQFTTGTTKDFVKSMALLISSFYVFNVEYPSKIENILTFIQKFFLNINEKSKTSDKVLKFMSVLKKKLAEKKEDTLKIELVRRSFL